MPVWLFQRLQLINLDCEACALKPIKLLVLVELVKLCYAFCPVKLLISSFELLQPVKMDCAICAV